MCSAVIENIWSFVQDSMQLVLSLTLATKMDEGEIVQCLLLEVLAQDASE